MGIKVSLEGRDRITEKYLHCVYDDVAVDIPLYADGQLNKDFALLYYKLEWGLSRFDELASEQIKVIYELIINDEDFYNLDSLFEDGHGSYSFEGFLRFFDEIEEWGDKFNGLTDDASYMHDDDFNDEPVKTQWEESCVPDDSNPHGFSPVQKDIIRFLEDVQSKVYSLNHIANEARLDRDDVFSAVKKLFRGGYLAHKYDTDVKKKQYFLTGKHLNVPGERPLYKFPPAKPQKFEDLWSCDVKDKIAKYLFHSKKPVGTVKDLADRLAIDLRDVQLTLKNMIEEGVVNNGDTYTLSAGHLEMLGSLPKGSDGTLEKYYLDA